MGDCVDGRVLTESKVPVSAYHENVINEYLSCTAKLGPRPPQNSEDGNPLLHPNDGPHTKILKTLYRMG